MNAQTAHNPFPTWEGGEVEKEVVHTSWESSTDGYVTPASSPVLQWKKKDNEFDDDGSQL